jgi:hypothetical protein
MERSSDGPILALFTLFLIGLAVVFGSGAIKNIGIPASANLLQSGPPAGDSVVGSPSISAQLIDQLLCKYSSPACGTGADLYNLGVQYNIDSAFALAVFWNESNFGRAGMAASTRSLGNLRCIESAACWNGYAAFPSWIDGYRSFYALISGPLYKGSGLTTPEAIIPRYAPSGDGNSPSHYIGVVESAMSLWRSGKVEVP